MPTDLSIIDGPYLNDILAQPQALEQTLAGLNVPNDLAQLAARLQKGKFKRVVLTGMGGSFHALHPLHLDLIDAGFTSVMVETSELIHYGARFLDATTLLLAVSQSGKSAETVRLLQLNRRRAAVVAVTNTADSPLARRADATILTNAGAEFSVSCKTYVASLMALRWLSEILRGRDLRRTRRELSAAPPAVASYISNWHSHVQQFAQHLRAIRHLFLVGRGDSLAAVLTGALIIKESDHFHAEGMSSAAFRHGPLEMSGPEMLVLAFAGDRQTRRLNERLVREIRQHQGQAELVGEDATYAPCLLPQTPTAVRPILEILPVQMVTLALAAVLKREPGRFSFCSKVTTTE